MNQVNFRCVRCQWSTLLLILALFTTACGQKAVDEATVKNLSSELDNLQTENQRLLNHIFASEIKVTSVADSLEDLGGQDARTYSALGSNVKTVAEHRLEILDSIHVIVRLLNTFSAKHPNENVRDNPNEQKETQMMLLENAARNGGRGSGKAIQLQRQLTSFEDLLRSSNDYLAGGNFQIQLEVKDITPDGTDQKWEQATFGSANALQANVNLEKVERALLQQNQAYLDAILKQLGISPADVTDQPVPDGKMQLRFTSKSDTIAAGMKFETELSIDNLPVGATPDYQGSGSVVFDDAKKTASMSITAPGGFAKGQTTKSMTMHAKALVHMPDGGIEELNLTGKFIVRIPRLIITPFPEKPLQKGKAQAFTVVCPDLGEYYSPQFQASNAKIQLSATDRTKFTLTPEGDPVILSVNSLTNGQSIVIDRITFEVKE
jgi:hypothetical protein